MAGDHRVALIEAQMDVVAAGSHQDEVPAQMADTRILGPEVVGHSCSHRYRVGTTDSDQTVGRIEHWVGNLLVVVQGHSILVVEL